MACGTPRAAESPSEAPPSRAPEPSARPASEPASGDEQENPSSAHAPAIESSAEVAGGVVSGSSEWDVLTDGRKSEPKKGLPELSMRHIGMHIGGESNTDEAKRPWLRAIESEQTRVLLCYRSVKEPMAGGTVGVDLYVGKSGGKPEVRRTRQHLGGPDFDDCVRVAFGAMRFPAPGRPTVVSYSLRFDVADPTRPR